MHGLCSTFTFFYGCFFRWVGPTGYLWSTMGPHPRAIVQRIEPQRNISILFHFVYSINLLKGFCPGAAHAIWCGLLGHPLKPRMWTQFCESFARGWISQSSFRGSHDDTRMQISWFKTFLGESGTHVALIWGGAWVSLGKLGKVIGAICESVSIRSKSSAQAFL